MVLSVVIESEIPVVELSVIPEVGPSVVMVSVLALPVVFEVGALGVICEVLGTVVSEVLPSEVTVSAEGDEEVASELSGPEVGDAEVTESVICLVVASVLSSEVDETVVFELPVVMVVVSEVIPKVLDTVVVELSVSFPGTNAESVVVFIIPDVVISVSLIGVKTDVVVSSVLFWEVSVVLMPTVTESAVSVVFPLSVVIVLFSIDTVVVMVTVAGILCVDDGTMDDGGNSDAELDDDIIEVTIPVDGVDDIA